MEEDRLDGVLRDAVRLHFGDRLAQRVTQSVELFDLCRREAEVGTQAERDLQERGQDKQFDGFDPVAYQNGWNDAIAACGEGLTMRNVDVVRSKPGTGAFASALGAVRGAAVLQHISEMFISI